MPAIPLRTPLESSLSLPIKSSAMPDTAQITIAVSDSVNHAHVKLMPNAPVAIPTYRKDGSLLLSCCARCLPIVVVLSRVKESAHNVTLIRVVRCVYEPLVLR